MIEEIGNNNPSATGSVPSESFANIPAPTAEVKIRTMGSDLASMAATGGGLPRFTKVNVEGLSISKVSAGAPESKKSGKPILVFLIILAALAVLIALGWLGYTILSNKGSAGEQSVTSGGNQSSSQAGATPVQKYQPAVTTPTSMPLAHVSLFKKPVDRTITFSVSSGGAAETASDLGTYDQKVLGVLAAVNKNANFIEIDTKGADGNDMSIGGLLSSADAEVLDANFLTAHFNPDATFFVYRDSNGFWPGYVIALRPGENQLSLKSGVQSIESSAKIGNIFLAGVGTASPSGFTDAVIASTTVRVLNFAGSPPTSFVYGWFQSYLIISASRDGFAQALARL